MRDKIAETLALAEKIKDPETEQANFYLNSVHETTDAFVHRAPLQGRAAYWIRATRLSGAARALEFGSGSGSNVMQAAMVDPAVEWCGMDVSKAQCVFSQAQAKRLGIPVLFQPFGYAQWFGAFDSVGVLDTLEHTAFPHELLEQAES